MRGGGSERMLVSSGASGKSCLPSSIAHQLKFSGCQADQCPSASAKQHRQIDLHYPPAARRCLSLGCCRHGQLSCSMAAAES